LDRSWRAEGCVLCGPMMREVLCLLRCAAGASERASERASELREKMGMLDGWLTPHAGPHGLARDVGAWQWWLSGYVFMSACFYYA